MAKRVVKPSRIPIQQRLPGTAISGGDWSYKPSPLEDWWSKPTTQTNPFGSPMGEQQSWIPEIPEEGNWKPNKYRQWETQKTGANKGKFFGPSADDIEAKMLQQEGERLAGVSASAGESPAFEMSAKTARATRVKPSAFGRVLSAIKNAPSSLLESAKDAPNALRTAYKAKGALGLAKSGLVGAAKQALPLSPMGIATDLALLGTTDWAPSLAEASASRGETGHFGREGPRPLMPNGRTRQAIEPFDIGKLPDLQEPNIVGGPPDIREFGKNKGPVQSAFNENPSFQPLGKLEPPSSAMLNDSDINKPGFIGPRNQKGTRPRMLQGQELPSIAELAPAVTGQGLPPLDSTPMSIDSRVASTNPAAHPDMQQNNDPANETAFNRYMRIMGNMPKEEDYKPSALRRIGAAMAGISEGWQHGAGAGFQASHGMASEPYDSAMQNWSTQLEHLRPMVQYETQEDNMKANIAYKQQRDALIHQTKDFEIKVRESLGNAKNINDADKIKLAAIIAEAKQHTADGQLELAQNKLEEATNFHKGLLSQGAAKIGIQARNVNSMIDSRKVMNDVRNGLLKVAQTRGAKVGGDESKKVDSALMTTQEMFNRMNPPPKGIELPPDAQGNAVDPFSFVLSGESDDPTLAAYQKSMKPIVLKQLATAIRQQKVDPALYGLPSGS